MCEDGPSPLFLWSLKAQREPLLKSTKKSQRENFPPLMWSHTSSPAWCDLPCGCDQGCVTSGHRHTAPPDTEGERERVHTAALTSSCWDPGAADARNAASGAWFWWITDLLLTTFGLVCSLSKATSDKNELQGPGWQLDSPSWIVLPEGWMLHYSPDKFWVENKLKPDSNLIMVVLVGSGKPIRNSRDPAVLWELG